MIPAATLMLAGSAVAFAASAAPSLPASETLKLAASSAEAGVQKAHYRRYWHYPRHYHHDWRHHHHHYWRHHHHHHHWRHHHHRHYWRHHHHHRRHHHWW
jgi:hypothetical protein